MLRNMVFSAIHATSHDDHKKLDARFSSFCFLFCFILFIYLFFFFMHAGLFHSHNVPVKSKLQIPPLGHTSGI